MTVYKFEKEVNGMGIPHGITIRGYTGAETVEVVTARNEAGDIPAWDTYPSKFEYFMPLTVKKSGLSLQTLKFCVKGYVPGTMRIVLRQYGFDTPLTDVFVDIIKGLNDVTASMGSIELKKNVEYQLYMAASNKFYPPSIQPEWVVENEYLDIQHGSAYYNDDTTLIFGGTVVLQEMTLGDELHTWKDLFLIPASRPIVQPPIEKTMTLDVEGMSGEADLSHGLTGYPVFSDREGSWQFYIDTDRWREANGFWGPVGSFAYRDIMRRLNRMMERPFQTKIIFDDDPLFYYVGRVWVSERPSQQYDHTKITLQYRLYPYKYLLVEDGDDWLWDTFCFETDIATVKTHDVAMKAGERETFPLVFTDKPSAVFVTSTGAATANMQNQNGVDYTLLGQESMPKTQYVFLTSFSSGGTSYECRLQTLVMPLVTKEYSIHMMGMELALYPVSTGKVTVSIRKKGTSVLLASDSFTVTRTSSGTGVEYQIFDGIGLMADLEKNTAYEIVVEAAGKVYVPNVPKESLTENDYLDFGTGAQAIAADSGGYELFCGSVSFYAGEGAVLKPGVKTNIGIVGTAPDNNGRVVVVQAEEDTSISIDYRPAYL